MSWHAAAKEVRDNLDHSIPEKWKLHDSQKKGLKDVTQVPLTCGLLSEDDLRITGLDASSLVAKLAKGELSATQVTEAFCGRAAIAHQLVNYENYKNPISTVVLILSLQVNCLTCYFPEAARKRAADLDEHFKTTGKVVGPLHGLPIALKVLKTHTT